MNITFKGNPIMTEGNLPAVGSKAPDFTLTKTDLGEIHLANYIGTRLVLNLFPSLDTPTCASAMLRFNEMAKLYPNVLFLCISADLPFAQQRFCSAKHLENVIPASVFRHPELGSLYGIRIVDGPLTGLLARAAVIINEHGKIEYTQLVKEISEEIDYEAVEEVLNKLSS